MSDGEKRLDAIDKAAELIRAQMSPKDRAMHDARLDAAVTRIRSKILNLLGSTKPGSKS